MKPNLALGLAALLALSAGCAGRIVPRELEAVGPDTFSAPIRADHGILRVYSAYDVHADFSELDRGRRRHSDYRLAPADGGTESRIHNDTRSSAEGPVPVDLAPGRYRVVARANGYGWVVVPVVIEPGRTTVVHLEGGDGQAAGRDREGSTMARLPGGEAIGPRAGVARTP